MSKVVRLFFDFFAVRGGVLYSTPLGPTVTQKIQISGRELLQRGLKLEKLKLTNSKDALQKSDQMVRLA